MSTLTLQKDRISIVDVQSMREILVSFYPEYKNQTYKQQAEKLNLEFNRDDITEKMLWFLDEPRVDDDIIDLQQNLKNLEYGRT